MIGFALGHYNKNQTQLKRSLLYCYFQASRFVMEPNRDIGRILPLLISWSACQIHIGFVSIGASHGHVPLSSQQSCIVTN